MKRVALKVPPRIVCTGMNGQRVEYVLGDRIGKGSFGSVYALQDTSKHRCIKLEQAAEEQPSFLAMEYRVYAAVHEVTKSTHFPRVYDYGFCSNTHFLVLDQGGKPLEHIAKELARNRWLFLHCLCLCIEAVRDIHAAGFLHRDIKPSNILYDAQTDRIMFIDMGFAKRFRTGPFDLHILDQNKKTLTGTLDFASQHILNGRENSRRCDLESLVYTFGYIWNNKTLPWSGLVDRRLKERPTDNGLPSVEIVRELGKLKKELSVTDIVGHTAPRCLALILQMTRATKFADAPAYNHMLRLVKQEMNEMEDNSLP